MKGIANYGLIETSEWFEAELTLRTKRNIVPAFLVDHQRRAEFSRACLLIRVKESLGKGRRLYRKLLTPLGNAQSPKQAERATYATNNGKVIPNRRLGLYTFMRLLACPLIVALSVFVSCFSSATGQTSVARAQSARAVIDSSGGRGKQRPVKQSPATVNVRPRVTASQPGTPTVKVAVDRKRVPLGDEVTFTLTPASLVLNPRYIVTISFGDGNQQRVRQTEIVYLYKATGTYTYSILVKSAEPPHPPQPAQDIPRVSLSANPTRVPTESPVTFTAQLSHSYPNIRYRFVFGDKSQTDWQDKAGTKHAYKFPGRYLAYVDIGAISSGGVKPLGGSVRQPIEVISPSARPVSVTLSASPIPVAEKQPATFVARVDSSEPNIRYRFDFGDRSGSTAWQVSPRTTHTYSVRGTYPARVDVRVINSRSGPQTASSKPLRIEVTAFKPDDKPTVDLTAVPQSVLAGLPVFFRATTASANSKTRYRFNFGDGSPPGAWQEKPEDTHIYSLAGNYPAFVEIGSATTGSIDALAASGKKQVRVEPIIPRPPETPTPTPPPAPSPSPTLSTSPSPSPNASPSVPGTPSPTPDGSPSPLTGDVTPSPTPSPSGTATPNPTPNGGGWSNDWWKYLLAALILFGGYQGWKAFYAPRPTLAPNLDPGNSELGAESGPLGINFQMELNRNVTDGQVAVNTDGGSLIKSERKSDG